MTLRPLALPLGSSPARYGHGGDTRLINCYSEVVGEAGKSQVNVHAVDGFTSFAALAGSRGIRCMLAVTDALMLVVRGRLLYAVDELGGVTTVGPIPSDGMVTMARNRVASPQVAIVCDGLYFGWQGGTLTQLSDPDLPPPVSVSHLNGYFSFLLQDGRHFATELDAFDVEPLSFATAGTDSDAGVRNWTRGQEMLFGGRRTIEVWQDVGDTPYPFARVNNIRRAEDQKDIGVLAGRSVAGGLFVGSDGTVRMIDGYTAVKVSGHYLDRLISNDAAPSNIYATSWERDGHIYYAVSGSTWTWVYDLTTKQWHERKSYGSSLWRVGTACQFGDKIILGNETTGDLYQLDPATYTEAGDHLVMQVNFAPFADGANLVRHKRVLVDAVPGVGLVSATDYLANPQLMLDYSDDGGATFSTERSATLGAAGDRHRRWNCWQLGTSRSRIYRATVSAPVARSLVGAFVDVESHRG